MKIVFASILLLVHINFSLFIAQVDETDIFDSSGQQKEDINNLVQYIDVIVLKHTHHKTKDTDDDNARYMHITKFDNRGFSQVAVTKKEYLVSGKIKFPPCIQKKLASVSLDVQGPPPKV